jgi:hypothetical protein
MGVCITGPLTVGALLVAIIFNFYVGEQFWCNVFLGVFGSALLTLITSLIGYFTERRSCMEGFYVECKKMLKLYSRYQRVWPLDDKIDFFLAVDDYDISQWTMYYGKMDFFVKKEKIYIFNEIYTPLRVIRQKITQQNCKYREHKNGISKNEAVMEAYSKEIEEYIFDIKKYIHNAEQGAVCSSVVHNSIVETILQKLDGKYYEIMYGKRRANVDKLKNEPKFRVTET